MYELDEDYYKLKYFGSKETADHDEHLYRIKYTLVTFIPDC